MSNISNKRKSELYKESISRAKEVRKFYKLGQEPIKDMYAFVEQQGFLIVSFPCLESKFSGFFTIRSDRKCIYINSKHSLGKQYYSIAHEIYHSFYDKEKTVICLESDVQTNENEYLANSFAANFLMPDEEVYNAMVKRGIIGSQITIDDAIWLQHYFRVSLTAMIIKLNKLGIITYYRSKELMEYTTIENKEELQRCTKRLGLNTDLILETSAYIPESFVKHLEKNFNDGKISEQKKKELELILDSLRKGTLFNYE